MNKDKVKEYASDKITEALSQVVADAYIAGYNAGYQDGIDKVAKDSALEGTEFVDLGLPSGTLWASDYVKDEDNKEIYLTQQAGKAYSIPTIEQWKELREKCQWEQNSKKMYGSNGWGYWHDWAICLGPNGNKIIFEKTGLYEVIDYLTKKDETFFWLKKEPPFGINSAHVSFDSLEVDTEEVFSGYKLPIRLVK